MANQFSVAVRNALAGQIETTIGTAPTLEIRTGAPPADCAASDSGTVLATLTLPSDWLTAPSAGTVSRNGTWQDLLADNSGLIGHYRIKQGATCHQQGTAGLSGDLVTSADSTVAGQPFTVNTFSITIGGA